MDEALKEIFDPLFESMLQGELNSHLGYKSNSKEAKTTANRRNGYGSKSLKTTRGEMDSNVPRDRDASFEPKLISKHSRDVSAIENKGLAMYAEECLSGTYQTPSMIFMDFPSLQMLYLILQIPFYRSLRTGKPGRLKVLCLYVYGLHVRNH